MGEHINFSLMQSNSNAVHESLLGQDMSNPLVNSGMSFVNPGPPMANTQCLVAGGQSIPISTQNQHSPPLINLNRVPNANSPLIETCIPHVMHSSSGINNSISDSPTCNMKQSTMMQVPMNPNESTQNPYKPPMKGQIIKTPDQRLMFVTEVNGGRVGYLIQQPKQTSVPQQGHTVSPIQPTADHVLNQHPDNQESNKVNIVNTDTINIDKVKCNTSGAINFTLGGNKDMKVTEPLIKTDIKSLREKLLNLRNPLNMKNQLNMKSSLTFPPMAKPEETATPEQNILIDQDKPLSPSTQLHSTTFISNSPPPSFESIDDDNSIEDSLDNELGSPKMDDMNNDEVLEEEGQEIEFSENDLVVDFDDTQHDNLSFHIEENREGPALDSDNEVSNQGPLSPKEIQPELPNKTNPKKGRSGKKSKESKNVLGNNEVPDGKPKRKGKSKVKKKKDNRKPKKPMKAYALFFRDAQKIIRVENPQLTFGEISKEVSKKWEVLEEAEKKRYQEFHEVAKLEYAERMKDYKELIAMEKLNSGSPLHSDPDIESNVPKQENKPVVQKKKGKGKKRKLADKVIEAKEVSEESEEELANHFELKEDADVEHVELPGEIKIPGKKLNVKKILKANDEDMINPPSSPSLPSSASTSGAEEEDSESAINRIREKAAELHKYLKQQRFVVTQKKSKQPDKKTRPGKSPDNNVDQIDKKPNSDDSDLLENEDVNSTEIISSTLQISGDEESLSVLKARLVDVKEDETVEQEEEMVIDDINETGGTGETEIELDEPPAIDTDLEDVNSEKDSINETVKAIDYDSEDDKPLRPVKAKKKRAKIKKADEMSVPKEETNPSRLRKRKPVKKVDETPKEEESDDDTVQPRRRKSVRKKKIIDTCKSDSEEESKDEDEESNISATNETNEISTPIPEVVNEEILDSKKETITETEITKEEITEDATDTELITPLSVEEKEPENNPPEILKNTFRIPKKSGPNKENGLLVLHGPRICIRQTCDKPAVTSKERGGQYCGNECLVLYCREVFESWVVDQEVEQKNKT